MSLLSNVNTLHLNKRWLSPWYENNPIYTNLLYSDLYIAELLNGIYYQLLIPSSLPIIKQINFDQLIILLNLYLFRKRKQKRTSLFFKEKKEFSLWHKKLIFNIHKTLYKRRKFIIVFKNKKNNKNINFRKIFIMNKKNNQKKFKNNKYLLFPIIKNNKLKMYMKNKKYLFFKYRKFKKKNKLNKKNIINFYKTYKYKNLYYLNNINSLNIDKAILNNNNIIYYLKLINKIYKVLNYKYFIKKKKLIYNNLNKKIKINKLIKTNKKLKYNKYYKWFLFNNLKRKNNILNKIENRIYRNIINKWKNNKKLNYINLIRKKKWLWKYKNNIQKRKKWQLKKIIKKKKKKSFLIKYKKYKKQNKKIWNRIKKRKKIKLKRKLNLELLNKKQINVKKNKNINSNLKLSNNLFIWLFKKLNDFLNILIYQLLLIYKLIMYRVNQNKLTKKLIKKNIMVNLINQFNIYKNNIFCIQNINFIDKIIYIYKKKINKKKKWYMKYYSTILLNHLRLKIINTLEIYLNKKILFIPYYKKKRFFPLTDVKLISDYLKIKMQIGHSIIRTLRNLILIHMKQRRRMIKRNKRYFRKFIKFRKRLRIKIKKASYIFLNKFIKINKYKYKHLQNRNNLLHIKIIKSNWQNNLLIKNKKKKIKKNNIIINILNFKNYISKKNNNKKQLNYLKYFNNLLNINNNIYKNKILMKIKYNKLIRKQLKIILFKWKLRMLKLGRKHFPLLGIRVECNGPTKKGKRTKMITYNEWVNDYRLPGKMPNVTATADVSYWQSYARIKRAAIGIKLWLFLYTPFYGIEINKKRIDYNIKL